MKTMVVFCIFAVIGPAAAKEKDKGKGPTRPNKLTCTYVDSDASKANDPVLTDEEGEAVLGKKITLTLTATAAKVEGELSGKPGKDQAARGPDNAKGRAVFEGFSLLGGDRTVRLTVDKPVLAGQIGDARFHFDIRGDDGSTLDFKFHCEP